MACRLTSDISKKDVHHYCQPSSDDGDVSNASEGEEDNLGAGGGDNFEEHKTRLAKGGDREAFKQLLSKNESFGL